MSFASFANLISGSNGAPLEPEMALFVPSTGELRTFSMLPESISDTKSVSYAERTVIGGSHPIYQWTNGGARNLEFSLLLAHDAQEGAGTLLQKSLNAVKNPLSALLSEGSTKSQGNQIMESVAWLRGLTHPDYTNQKSRRLTGPPALKLYLLSKGGEKKPLDQATFILKLDVIMTGCNIHFDSFFQDGWPRLATVSLNFAEITQATNNWVVRRSESERMFGHTSTGKENAIGGKLVKTTGKL